MIASLSLIGIALAFFCGFYWGRRAGFNEVLALFNQQDADLEEIKKRTAELHRES